MNTVFYHINESTFILIIMKIREKLLANNYKILTMHNVNIQVFTSAVPGLHPVFFFKIKLIT